MGRKLRGPDLKPDSGDMRPVAAQQDQIAASGLPYTVLRATQFVQFIDAPPIPSPSGQRCAYQPR
jgi:uncharacterized protein YbjT (DUF2867 family)